MAKPQTNRLGKRKRRNNALTNSDIKLKKIPTLLPLPALRTELEETLF